MAARFSPQQSPPRCPLTARWHRALPDLTGRAGYMDLADRVRHHPDACKGDACYSLSRRLLALTKVQPPPRDPGPHATATGRLPPSPPLIPHRSWPCVHPTKQLAKKRRKLFFPKTPGEKTFVCGNSCCRGMVVCRDACVEGAAVRPAMATQCKVGQCRPFFAPPTPAGPRLLIGWGGRRHWPPPTARPDAAQAPLPYRDAPPSAPPLGPRLCAALPPSPSPHRLSLRARVTYIFPLRPPQPPVIMPILYADLGKVAKSRFCAASLLLREVGGAGIVEGLTGQSQDGWMTEWECHCLPAVPPGVYRGLIHYAMCRILSLARPKRRSLPLLCLDSGGSSQRKWGPRRDAPVATHSWGAASLAGSHRRGGRAVRTPVAVSQWMASFLPRPAWLFFFSLSDLCPFQSVARRDFWLLYLDACRIQELCCPELPMARCDRVY